MQEVKSDSPQYLNEYGEPCQKISNYDFVKKIQPLGQVPGYFVSITENQYVCLFNINKNQDQFSLDCKVKKKFGTYIYDVAPIPNKCINIEHQNNMDIIAVTSKNTPVHLYTIAEENNVPLFKYLTSFTHIRFNSEYYTDFLTTQHDSTTNKLLLGGKNTLLGYDLEKLQLGYRSKKIGKKEIISCMTLPENNSSNIAVFGNFDRNIKVMSINSDEVIAELNAHMGGLTCLKLSPVDQNYLVSGGRKDNLVYLWDMRNTSTFVTYFERRSFTNQRLNFDISLDNHLYLGNEDGTVVVYDLKDSSTKSYFQAGKESVNNVSLVYLENERKGFMVSTSGERNFSLEDTSNRIEVEDDSADEDEKVKGLFIPPSNENNLKSNVIKLWEVPYAEKVIQSNIEVNSSDTVKVTEETIVTTQEVIVNETAPNNVEMVVETEQNVQITESVADKSNQIIEESL